MYIYIYIYINVFHYFQESLYFSFTPAHFHWVICHATPSAGEVADIPTRACHRGKHNSSGSQPQGAAETVGLSPAMQGWLCEARMACDRIVTGLNPPKSSEKNGTIMTHDPVTTRLQDALDAYT